jgi:hypothetical protein
MKVQIVTTQQRELKMIIVSAHVRYWEDASFSGKNDTEEGSLVPLRHGDNWRITIDPDTGRIYDWPVGVTGDIHYKVCDRCSWSFVDSSGATLREVENEYVPGWLCPKEPGYGDYIIMEINGDGVIQDWEFKLWEEIE